MSTVVLGTRRVIQALAATSILLAGCAQEPTSDPDIHGTACATSLISNNPSLLREVDTHTIHYSILVEVTDNSTSAQEAILREISPFLECAVHEESYLRIALDGGVDTPVITPSGFEGSERLDELRDLEKVNSRGEEKAKEEAVKTISAELTDSIAEIRISNYGSASRLLALAATESSSLPAADYQVIVLWSPLLGTSENQTDCLDVTGIEATENNADAIIRRCVDSSLLTPVSAAGVRMVGAAYGAKGAEQQRFAGLLQRHLYESVFGVTAEGTQ